MKYPIVTKENFEEITNKYVTDEYEMFLKVHKPRNRKEFAELTKNMFGVKLTFTGNIGNYSIEQKQDIYAKNPIYKLWDKKYGEYDGLKIALNTTFGVLSCGGVAGSHYGQYKYPNSYRNKIRLYKLYSSRL